MKQHRFFKLKDLYHGEVELLTSAPASIVFLKKITAKLEKQVGLPYVAEGSTKGGVCFAQSPEVRNAFKIHFTPQDLVNYIIGEIGLEHKADNKDIRIPYPANQTEFWTKVEKGAALQKTLNTKNGGSSK